jgi:EAL domain-containing protein (putative c-di-GMP-specific phosphodiesterase class I)
MNGSPLGALSPAEFIPIAEDTGLIIDITYLVLEKVCRFVRKLMDSNVDIVSVSVNFSSVQFAQENVTERVFQIIEKNGVPYSKIKIEITERALIDNYSVVSDFINAIHAKGVRFALDDFGTGYSNISTVLGFPINTVKLDKSLIWSSIENPKSEAVVRHMVAAFKEIGVDVLAEGVENEEHRDFVIDCGCDMIQGFLYSRPVPADQACLFLGKKLSDLPFEEH